MSKVGVLLNCHEYVEYTRAALDSAMDQQYPPDAIYAVVDAPSKENWKKYESILQGIEHYTTPENVGISGARNIGFQELIDRGMDFIIPLDEDDILHKQAVRRAKQAIEIQPDVSVHYWDWVMFDEEDNKYKYIRVPEWKEETMFERPFIISCSAISGQMWRDVKRSNGTGYDVELMRQGLRWEDYLFYLEGTLLGCKMARIGICSFTRVRRHGVSGTTVADATRPQWYEYARRKLETLYGCDPNRIREIPLSSGES